VTVSVVTFSILLKTFSIVSFLLTFLVVFCEILFVIELSVVFKYFNVVVIFVMQHLKSSDPGHFDFSVESPSVQSVVNLQNPTFPFEL